MTKNKMKEVIIMTKNKMKRRRKEKETDCLEIRYPTLNS